MGRISVGAALLAALLGSALQCGAAVIHLIGDSTCANVTSSIPTRGWGQKLPEFVAPGISVNNRAYSGYSAKSFLEGTSYMGNIWPVILDELHPGDWVLVNLGINDAVNSRPELYSTTTEFGQRLGIMADDIRARGAEVVFLTQTPTRSFDAAGNLQVNRAYPDAMVAAAGTYGMQYLDINAALTERYNALGPGASNNYGYLLPDGVTWDQIHFNDWGARQVAELVASRIQQSNIDGLSVLMVPEPAAAAVAVVAVAGMMIWRPRRPCVRQLGAR